MGLAGQLVTKNGLDFNKKKWLTEKLNEMEGINKPFLVQKKKNKKKQSDTLLGMGLAKVNIFRY